MAYTRDEVFDLIANAALFGSLGLFVGTGFSKALTEGNALSFEELITGIADEVDCEFDFNDIEIIKGKSYPRLAQDIVAAVAERDFGDLEPDEAFVRSLKKVKKSACKLCNLRPSEVVIAEYSSIIKGIPIQWVITTNYDFILEHIIPRSIHLLPNQLMNPRKDYVPIYHLHGHLRSSSSLVLTELDYVKLFSPIEYRQLKLNLLLAESTTLVIGYSLGDINVQSAMEWSRTFQNGSGLTIEKYQSKVVQALFVEEIESATPYEGENGEIILEINDIKSFLEEVKRSIDARQTEHDASLALLQEWFVEDRLADLIADDEDSRRDFITTINQFPRSYDVQTLTRFLDGVLDPVWTAARADGGFNHYNRYLSILLDILENVPATGSHPALISYLGERLGDLSYYIDPDGRQIVGTSFQASLTWQRRKENIPGQMKQELLRYAESNRRHSLKALLTR